MQNWTIGKRIVIGGAILLTLLVIVSGVAIEALSRLREFSGARLRDDAIPGIVNIGTMSSNSMRSQIRMLTAGAATTTETRDKNLGSLAELSANVTAAMKRYEEAVNDDDDRANLESLKQKRSAYNQARDTYVELLRAGKKAEADQFVSGPLDTTWAPYRDQMEAMLTWNQDYSTRISNEMTAISTHARQTTLVVCSISLAIAFAIGWIIIRTTNRALRQVAESLQEAAEQVNVASGQVSASSQSIAEGASEQAASLEETSASLEEISSMTKRNAESAESARRVATETSEATASGTGQMERMVDAMNAIKSSSDNIAKIIKTIDEIAFQTNILALNAAVEAARAGEAGAGFAVVADEVRALAQRAAQAAKETAEKIDDSIEKSGHGVEISAQVAIALKAITDKTGQVNGLVMEIATASREQTQGLGQVNTAVSQMDKVTQNNAGNAEETAAAAEELTAQAATMLDSVTDLRRLVGASNRETLPRSLQKSNTGKARAAQSSASSAPLIQPVRERGANQVRAAGAAKAGEDFFG